MVEQPHHVQVHQVSVCSRCATDLQAVEPCGHERRQVSDLGEVFDLPPAQIEVTEHRVYDPGGAETSS